MALARLVGALGGMGMHGATFPKGTDGWSRHQANTLLRAVTDMFHKADIQSLVDRFAEDCAVCYGVSPEQRGRVALRRVLTALLLERPNLRVQKTCIAIDRNTLVIRSQESWSQPETGKPMTGLAVEIWTMREGKIAAWEAAFSAGEAGEVRLLAAA